MRRGFAFHGSYEASFLRRSEGGGTAHSGPPLRRLGAHGVSNSTRFLFVETVSERQPRGSPMSGANRRHSSPPLGVDHYKQNANG